jgi:hypothetical protein
VIGDAFTPSFAPRRNQIARNQAQAAMRHQRGRVDIQLDGELKSRGTQLLLSREGQRSSR